MVFGGYMDSECAGNMQACRMVLETDEDTE